jgi:hypothetical protein
MLVQPVQPPFIPYTISEDAVCYRQSGCISNASPNALGSILVGKAYIWYMALAESAWYIAA